MGKRFLAALWVILWIICLLCPEKTPAAYQTTPITKIENIVFHSMKGDILTFLTNREGRILILKGQLCEKTRIFDSKGQSLSTEGISPGGVWIVELQYLQTEGLPIILEMRRTEEHEAN
jgi:hypothetical protein